MTEKKSPRGNKVANGQSKPRTKKTVSETGFSQKAKPVRRGYSSTTGDTKPKKKANSETGFSQTAKPVKKGYSSMSGDDKPKKKFSDTGFSQKAKPDRKGYSSTFGENKTKKKTNSDIGFSQKAKPVKKGYSSTYGDNKPKKDFTESKFKKDYSENKPKKDYSENKFKKTYTENTPKKDFSETNLKKDFSENKPKKDFSETNSEKPKTYRKKTSDIGFSQKAKPVKKGYYTQTDKPTTRKKTTNDEKLSGERPFQRKKFNTTTEDRESSRFLKKPTKTTEESTEPKKFTGRGKKPFEKTIPVPEYNLDKYEKRKRNKKTDDKDTDENGLIRLNRYIANSGICSRRDADLLIQAGEIKINGNIVTELGYKVKPSDTVKYGSRTLNREKMVYVLLNKPKDFITTTDDPEERKTVMDLVSGACPQRIYPVGRLDRNTTGLLLLTNDGELAEKLTHPSNEVKKLYEVELNKPVEREHFEAMLSGVELEDGKAQVDEMATVTPDKSTLGVQIHSGRNRIVRRLFEHFGYDVIRLDRVMYAGLTKKDLPRGNWRFLTEREVITLKFLL